MKFSYFLTIFLSLLLLGQGLSAQTEESAESIEVSEESGEPTAQLPNEERDINGELKAFFVEEKITPVHLSFYTLREDESFHFILDIFYNHIRSVKGAQLGGFLNKTTHHVVGFQGAGLFNEANGIVSGFQGAGVINIAHDVVVGFQAAGLFNAANSSLSGAQTAGLFNITTESIKGFQGSGLFSLVDGNFYGLQAAGLFNSTKGSFKGLQTAGLFNSTKESLHGFQAAGLFNTSSDIVGFQAAGLFNIARDASSAAQVAGFFNTADTTSAKPQLAGLFNITEASSSGTQIAGIFNISNGEATYFQGAGILNRTKAISGVQLGVINIAEEREGGIQLGVINYVADSHYLVIEAGYSTTLDTSLSFKSGHESLYSIISAVGTYRDGTYYWGYGLGFGSEILLSSQDQGNRLALNIETEYIQIHPTDRFDLDNQLLRFSLGPAFYLFEESSSSGFGFFASLIADLQFTRDADRQFSHTPPVWTTQHFDQYISLTLGAKAGIRYRI